MKAILSPKSGPPDVLHLAEVERPTPTDGEILVRIRYATVSMGDVKMRRLPRLLLTILGALFGFRPMKIPGVEFAGEVAELGPGVTDYAVGDAVVGTTTGLSYGANAEFVRVPVAPRHGVLVRKPEGLGFREAAAAVVGPMTALQILKRARIESGTRVLVYGASGSVGSYALQLARHFGAEVTAVCSTANLELVRSLGADAVIDYTATDFAAAGKTYDLVFDAVGKISRRKVKPALAEGARFLSVKGPTKERTEELALIQSLVAQGRLRPAIDREITLSEVPEAHAYVESGRKKGNVVVAVAG